jgi:hypothetical protein
MLLRQALENLIQKRAAFNSCLPHASLVKGLSIPASNDHR